MSRLYSILVVDDEEMNRDILSRRLEREGYLVTQAESGAEVLEKMQVELFDLVLLDFMMPVMDGLEVLQQMRSTTKTKHIPVIMTTAITARDTVLRCIESGAQDYVVKPFDMTVLKARVLRCLHSSDSTFVGGMEGRDTASNAQVLVVDDNPVNRDLLSRRISKMGYAVETAESGRKALELLQSKQFDLIILDILMPDMNGMDLLKLLKVDLRFHDTPVLMLSALDDSATMTQCFNLGAEDYACKPFNTALLQSRVGLSIQAGQVRKQQSEKP